jgi:predicted membrane metal-binding protein
MTLITLTILAGILIAISRPLFSLHWPIVIVLATIVLYVVLIGTEPAVVRASLMASLVAN